MANEIFGPRKRRTQMHVIADLAVHHVEGFILERGHTAEKVYQDYGYDLVLTTFDTDGFPEPGVVFFQVKSHARLTESVGQFVQDVDIRDYHAWMNEMLPVILVLYDATQRCAVWIDIQRFFRENGSPRPRSGAKSIRVRIPLDRRLDHDAIETIRAIKARVRAISGE